MSRTVYVSGPISFMPDHNRHAFAQATKLLSDHGYIVVNPLELIDGEQATWAECMKVDIAALLKCDAVYVLPGWNKSRGATLEVLIACKLFMPVFDLSGQPVTVVEEIDWSLLQQPGVAG